MSSRDAEHLFSMARVLCHWAALLWNTERRSARRLIAQAAELLEQRSGAAPTISAELS
jgi:hypothetical protein